MIWNRYKNEYEIERETLDAYHIAIEALSADAPSGDLISREAAIDEALMFFIEYLGGAFDEDSQRLLAQRMNLLPSAEPVHGEWVVEERDSIYGKKIRLTCSECGDVFDVTESAYPYERYCRYCGAKMDGGVSDGDTD